MKSKKGLQEYFSILTETKYNSSIHKNLTEPFKSLIRDIGLLLEVDLIQKESKEIRVKKEFTFKKVEIKNDGKQIDCFLTVANIKDGAHYINLAKEIAHFFNNSFPYSEKDLNLDSPSKHELKKGYELKDDNNKLMFSAGINLSNELCEIRFTIIKE